MFALQFRLRENLLSSHLDRSEANVRSPDLTLIPERSKIVTQQKIKSAIQHPKQTNLGSLGVALMKAAKK